MSSPAWPALPSIKCRLCGVIFFLLERESSLQMSVTYILLPSRFSLSKKSLAFSSFRTFHFLPSHNLHAWFSTCNGFCGLCSHLACLSLNYDVMNHSTICSTGFFSQGPEFPGHNPVSDTKSLMDDTTLVLLQGRRFNRRAVKIKKCNTGPIRMSAGDHLCIYNFHNNQGAFGFQPEC